MFSRSIFRLSPEDKERTIKYLIESSYPGSHFFVMLLASAVIATAGLLLNNSAVIIGSMLVAPFLSPILSLSMGIVLADFTLIRRSAVIIAKATGIAIAAAVIFAVFIAAPKGYTPEILSRTEPSLPYLYVAIAAGVAASFAVAKPAVAEMLAGVAISVSLLPPLAASGIGLRGFDAALALGAFQLYIISLIGIVFAGMGIFSLMGFYPSRTQAEKEIAKETKKLEEE